MVARRGTVTALKKGVVMRLTIVLALLCGLAWLTGPPTQVTKKSQEEGQIVKKISTSIFAAAAPNWTAREGSHAVVQPNAPNYTDDQMGQSAAIIAVNSRTDIATTRAMTGRVAQNPMSATVDYTDIAKMEPGAGLPLLC